MNKKTRIFVGISAILLGSFQIYKAVVIDKKQKVKKQEILDNLYQYQQDYHKNNPVNNKEIVLPSVTSTIDSIQENLKDIKAGLDSIGENLNTQQ